MARYLYLGEYVAGGMQGMIAEGGSGRETETRAAFSAVGGSVETYQFAIGGDIDFVIIAEMPDAATAMVPPMLAEATGTVSVRTIPLLGPAEFDTAAAAARGLSFRAAGH